MSEEAKNFYHLTLPEKPQDKIAEPSPSLEPSEKQGTFWKTALLFILDVFLNAVVLIALVVLIRNFLISPFQVHGPSMCDTLNNINGRCIRGNGEYLILNKANYLDFGYFKIGEPERGDIIVFHPPDGDEGEFYIKRIIGLPGETVKLIDGFVYIFNEEYPDGWLLDESSYLNETNYGKTYPFQKQLYEFEVPKDDYFMLGDNRRVSSDSRRCFEQIGCNSKNSPYLSKDLIEGKAWIVLWPLNQIRILEKVDYFAENE